MARILIVGADSSWMGSDLKRITANRDNEVLFADTAANALQKLAEPFDVVITDFNLEENQSGIKVLQAAMEQNAGVRAFLCVSAGVEMPNLPGAYDCLPQSIYKTDVPELVDKIIAAIGQQLILLAEDEGEIARLLSHFLETESRYKVHHAFDSNDFLAKVSRYNYRLIILDLYLGPSNGIELLERIRASGSQVPIIVMTAHDVISTRILAFTLGADDFIAKPVALSELVQRIELLLRRSTHPTERERDRTKQLCDLLVRENTELKRELDTGRNYGRTQNQFDITPILENAGHDLNNDLMIGFGAIKNLRAMALDPDAVEEIDRIHRALSFSQRIAERLLSLHRSSANLVTIVSVGSILDDLGKLIIPRIPNRITLHIPELPAQVRDFKVRDSGESIMSGLIELLINASRAIGESAGRIDLSIKNENETITFTVKDNGPGIPAHIREHLFREQLASNKGAGLGLYLTARTVESIGGMLTLGTTSGKGTEFSISLPIYKEDNSNEGDTQNPAS